MRISKAKKFSLGKIILWTVLLIQILFMVSAGPFLYQALLGKPAGFSNSELDNFERVYRDADYFVMIEFKALMGNQIILGQLSGSIIEIDNEIFILTAGHIQRSNRTLMKINVLLRDGRIEKAGLVGYHNGLDVALLKFSDPEFVYDGPVAKFGDSSTLEDGDKIMIIGSSSDSPEKTLGAVIDYWWLAIFKKDLVCSAVTVPGYSGGPILNGNGEVIAMATKIVCNFTEGKTSYTFGPKINDIIKILPDLKNGKQMD